MSSLSTDWGMFLLDYLKLRRRVRKWMRSSYFSCWSQLLELQRICRTGSASTSAGCLSTSTILLLRNQMEANDLSIQNFGKSSVKLHKNIQLNQQGFVVRFDQTEEFVAIGCNDGTKHIYSLQQEKIVGTISNPDTIPCTSLRWRPQAVSHSKVLVTVDSQAEVAFWHAPTWKKLFSFREENNSILCLDFSPNGTQFATAGKDFNIRIYDEGTKSVEVTLAAAQWDSKGHSNRVFAVKFIDENTLVSGGWDSVVHVWDIREANSVRSFYGPHLSGDALDYQNGQILTGSHSNKDQLQLWDFQSGKLIQNLDWSVEKDIAYIYSAQFGKFDKNSIVAGTSGSNEVRVFRKDGNSYKCSNRIKGLKGGCFSVDCSLKKNEFVFTDSSGAVYFIDTAPK